MPTFGACRALRDIEPGEEMFTVCGFEEAPYNLPQAPRVPIERLADQDSVFWGLGNLEMRRSTIPDAGRGAFARSLVAAGQVVATSPVIHFHAGQLQRIEQQWAEADRSGRLAALNHHRSIKYNATKVLGYQLVMNYCLGHPDSDVVLLPYGPVVNYINHAPTANGGHTATEATANVRVKWKGKASSMPDVDAVGYLNISAHELFSLSARDSLMIQYVALRDIQPGEEIFLDYGMDWQSSYERFQLARKSEDKQGEEPTSAEEYSLLRAGNPFPAVSGRSPSLPSNLRAACLFSGIQENEEYVREAIKWSPARHAYCLRHCTIMRRYAATDDDEASSDFGNTASVPQFFYDVHVKHIINANTPEECQNVPREGVHVNHVPHFALAYVDATLPGSSAAGHGAARADPFRHLIHVPSNFFPQHWNRIDVDLSGDFIDTKLDENHFEVIRWKPREGVANDEKFANQPVTPHAYRIAMPRSVRAVLLDYCDRMGFSEIMAYLTKEGNALPAGTDSHMIMHNGEHWFLQRPDSKWKSDLQWLSPANWESQQSYIQALGAAGFDEVLASIGEKLSFDSLVAYQVTFIAVSVANKGMMHYDFLSTGAKAFNLIMPLILANETGPELDLREYSEGVDDNAHLFRSGRYRYEYDVASMIGDEASHGTSAVDYRHGGEFRLAATVYIADMSEANVDAIKSHITQVYPPLNREFLLDGAGAHWRRNDPTVKLPLPGPDHVLNRPPLNSMDPLIRTTWDPQTADKRPKY
jgi:SET domain